MQALPGWASIDIVSPSVIKVIDGYFVDNISNITLLTVGLVWLLMLLPLWKKKNGKANDYQLYKIYPDPFNPKTTTKYALLETGHVRITIYDVLSRHVRTLVDVGYSAGNYSTE